MPAVVNAPDVPARDPGDERTFRDQRGGWRIGHPAWAALFAVLLCLGLALTAARCVWQYQTPGPFDLSRTGFCDFHNGIYFPSLALLRGVSPYGAAYASEYPVARQIPFFSPAIVALHTPLAMLSLHVAEVIYFALMIAMVLWCARECVLAAGTGRRWDLLLAVAAAIVFSRAGHMTLFNGYFTLELILGTFVAIQQAGKRPWLSALALVLVSGKPTYILPIGFLMLARGNVRELIYGAVLSIVAAAIPTLWLAWNLGDGNLGAGVTALMADISQAQDIHRADPNELPIYTWTRIDAFAVLAKWAGRSPGDAAHLVVMLLMLVLPMYVLDRRRRAGVDDGLAGVTGSIILVGSLVTLYHHTYDAMLVFAPVTGMLAAVLPEWRRIRPWHRVALAALLLAPVYSYPSAKSVLDRFDWGRLMEMIVTSASGVMLFAALVWICLLGLRQLEPRAS